MVKVALVSVNYNGKEDSLELLDWVSKLTVEDFQLSVILVDNGSQDGLVSSVLAKYPKVEVLQNGINKGFSGGYNRGIEHALIWGADFVLIINNDAAIKDPNFIAKMLEPFKKDQQVGIVAPKIYFEKGYEFQKARYSDKDLGKVLWFAGGEFDFDNVMTKHRGIDEIDKGDFDTIEEAEFLTGCCMMIKRPVLEQVGLFNQDYFAYWEDADFCMRVKRANFKLIYNGEAAIYHKVSKASGIGSTIVDYYLTRNRLKFGSTYSSIRTKFALYRQALAFLISGREAQKKAVWDFLKNKTGAMSKQTWSEKTQYPNILSVVSVNYNTPDLIENLLQSIYQIDSGREIFKTEVIILDNGSGYGCAEVVKKFPQVKFIQNPQNTGFTGGYNKAMKYSSGQYILLLNSDIECTEGSLEQIVEEAQNHNENAIVSGALFFPNGDLQDSVFFLPTIFGALKEYFLGLKGSFFMYAPKQNKNTRVEAAAMACFLIPRKILTKIGFLNERLFTYFEDVDYCRRLKREKIPIYYTPKAKFIHHHGATGKRLEKGKAYQLLQRAAKIYYGLPYYHALSFVLKVCQKISWVKTPQAR